MSACTSDACLPTKKAILAGKEIIEEVFQELKTTIPNLTIDETYTLEEGKIAPKRGIFPSSILSIPKGEDFPQPIKIMIFINVLNAREKEAEISGGWSFGPGADTQEEAIYVKLLEVVFFLKQENGPLFKGNLKEKAEIQTKIRSYLQKVLQDYRQILKTLA